jgi:hypothetical protein
MLSNETESKREEKGKAAIIPSASSCVGRKGEPSCGTCNGSCRVLGSRLSNVRCVISVPSQNLEIPVFFKAWIYEEHREEITENLRNQLNR